MGQFLETLVVIDNPLKLLGLLFILILAFGINFLRRNQAQKNLVRIIEKKTTREQFFNFIMMHSKGFWIFMTLFLVFATGAYIFEKYITDPSPEKSNSSLSHSENPAQRKVEAYKKATNYERAILERYYWLDERRQEIEALQTILSKSDPNRQNDHLTDIKIPSPQNLKSQWLDLGERCQNDLFEVKQLYPLSKFPETHNVLLELESSEESYANTYIKPFEDALKTSNKTMLKLQRDPVLIASQNHIKTLLSRLERGDIPSQETFNLEIQKIERIARSHQQKCVEVLQEVHSKAVLAVEKYRELLIPKAQEFTKLASKT